MQYQDELESGRRTLKSGMTIQGQVEHYRKKLIRKVMSTHINYILIVFIPMVSLLLKYTKKLIE